MSGEIFQPMENIEESCLTGSRNPLLCFLCNNPYEDPRIFGCFHSFCAHCLRGRDVDGKITCPLCGYIHNLKDGAVLPLSDLLLKFMVESSTEDRAQCANCDSTSHQMFFCNTCSQPLCPRCREETHKAKMFAAHDMVLLTKKAREVHKKCSLHGEPYIMFSSEKKIMLCINCFRDMRIESRGHCLDLETAYKQSCKKLDIRVQAFRDLQNSVRDSVVLFRALLEEIKTNAENEKEAIESLCDGLLQKIEETKAMLLQKVNCEFSQKEATFHGQLRSLSALLPTLQLHLVIASAFSSSANKFEFLDLAYVLMERLKSIVQKQHPIHPTQSGQIDTAYKSEFYKSFEPLLHVPKPKNALAAAAATSSVSAGASVSPPSPLTQRVTPNRRTHGGLNGAKVRFIDAKGSFAEHCREFETAHRDLLHRFEQMKLQCQELQRDLTMRRCLARQEEVAALHENVAATQADLEAHCCTLQAKLPLLEQHWEEALERLHNEQDLFNAQVQDSQRLKNESGHLRVIASQLSSFVSSIASVTERLAPKLDQSCRAEEANMSTLMEEINSLTPDSQQRVEAIRGAEEERQTHLANKTNPLDDELIKTKGLLRAPSFRDKKGDRKRRERDSATIGAERLLEKRDRDGSDRLTDLPNLQDILDSGRDVEDEGHVEPDTADTTGPVFVDCGSVTVSATVSSTSISDDCSHKEAVLFDSNSLTDVYMSSNNLKSKSLPAVALVSDSQVDLHLSPNNMKSKTLPHSREDTRGKGFKGEPNTVRSSSELDSDTIRNLLKDIEKVKKCDTFLSSSRKKNSGDLS